MKKNQRQKGILLMAACLVLAGALAGCSKTETNSTEGSADKSKAADSIRIIKGPIDPDSTPSDADIKYVSDKIGVNLKIETFPWNDYTQKVQTLIASGDLPDLLRPNGQGGNIDQIMIKQGAALALDDLLPKYAPNLWKTMPKEAWDKVRAASPDGKIYYLPKYDLFPRLGIMMRKDWLDAVGMKVPTTQAELVEVLKAFRDKDPNGNGQKDELPTSGREGARWMDELFSMYGVGMYEGYPDWNLVDGKLVYSGITPNMKASLEFIKLLYKEKLLDNETFLNKSDTWSAKIKNDQVGMWFHIPSEGTLNFNAMKQKNPKADVIVIPVPKVEGYEGFVSQKAMGFVDYMIPKSAEKNAANVLKYLDWWYTEEGKNFQLYGQENQTWVKENGQVKYLAEKDTPAQIKSREFALSGLSYWDMDFRKKIVAINQSEYGKKIPAMWEISQPAQKLLPADGMPNSVFDGFGDISTHKIFQEYAIKIIMGDYPIEKFDEFVEKWKKSGGDEVTKKANEWYSKVNKK
ncbi:extracellular solute-binding protein [Paenibacillus radicis (ex Xue et al. 2023)]|uniref:Extracellular solute-binding protein n=1 Tax=Paenibacillus radicis (ex Xue et al. 2023) TaxID=2972489 RepID=A0ABT1YIK9_9BACL|nr:extracellular solute-binding protein [Paenibacillus radicis (ex Xue et al. 2023)]MCR8633019.1 extracellular solute-binding protein [Paenibacillus radicis (ex Xue et al. 2023)]